MYISCKIFFCSVSDGCQCLCHWLAKEFFHKVSSYVSKIISQFHHSMSISKFHLLGLVNELISKSVSKVLYVKESRGRGIGGG